MALVSYSDSESEPETPPQIPENTQPQTAPPPPPAAATQGTFQAVVDRSNPRKIRIALPDAKPENNKDYEECDDDQPARKKAKIGGGGGTFSGFNSLLPAPKRKGDTNENDNKTTTSGLMSTRKVFSLKTGATPGFDREADQKNGGDENEDEKPGMIKEEPKLKGNVTMFRPLSVARNQKKKKSKATTTSASQPAVNRTAPTPAARCSSSSSQVTAGTNEPDNNNEAKRSTKVSLFSLSADDNSRSAASEDTTTYEPLLVHDNNTYPETTEMEEQHNNNIPTQTQAQPQIQTLDDVADELNLSSSQRRHLFGNQRHRQQQPESSTQVLTFNADTEYSANQALARETDLAAVQHNPVRPIAPGKHTLQQLVNAASNQRDALEESFATGRRNKKEAGSKYGW